VGRWGEWEGADVGRFAVFPLWIFFFFFFVPSDRGGHVKTWALRVLFRRLLLPGEKISTVEQNLTTFMTCTIPHLPFFEYVGD